MDSDFLSPVWQIKPSTLQKRSQGSDYLERSSIDVFNDKPAAFHCGLRDHEEFSYFGDATKAYPALAPENHDAWADTVYTRKNPRSIHTEFWQHTLGCRRWLVVKRHTVTHDIESVVIAAERELP